MLNQLSVKNYVLIDELEINFEKGLTIITGETGAGKSILLGALGLILGQRADSGSLLKKDQKCIIEGAFNLKEYQLQEFFNVNELDYADETLIRREINPEGKSRAFINDTPVTLNVLKDLSSRLVDIHSQHETLLLNSNQFQLTVVDAYSGNDKKLEKYHTTYKAYFSAINELKIVLDAESKGKSDFDYFQFQFNELEEANLLLDEQDALEQEQKKLTHAEEIRSQLAKSTSMLSGSEENLINSLSLVQQQVIYLNRFGDIYSDLGQRLKSTLVELKDIAEELDKAEQEINLDPQRLEIVENRLSFLYKLQQKHRVNTIDELINLRNDFNKKLAEISSFENSIEEKKLKVQQLFSELTKFGNELTLTRKNAIPGIEKDISKSLSELAMSNAVLRIAVHPAKEGEFFMDGLEQIQFLFSANKGIDFRELNKVASGGELSRLMLCIKALLAKLSAMPTVIFDEIDTGISGETASKVGSILKLMAKKHQVIAISHLPQMASKGDAHYLVYKEEKRGNTRTHLKLLQNEDRINEIARMLSGEQLTAAAIGNARELLASTN